MGTCSTLLLQDRNPKARKRAKGTSELPGGHGHRGNPSRVPRASRPLRILTAPRRDNSGKWSRSNSKGMAGQLRTRRWEVLQVR